VAQAGGWGAVWAGVKIQLLRAKDRIAGEDEAGWEHNLHAEEEIAAKTSTARPQAASGLSCPSLDYDLNDPTMNP
jgi:hypothetical protein